MLVNAKEWWTETWENFGPILWTLSLENYFNDLYFNFLVLIDVSESPTDEKKPIDIYAIGFEEMVDLDAKNIMNTRYLTNYLHNNFRFDGKFQPILSNGNNAT